MRFRYEKKPVDQGLSVVAFHGHKEIGIISTASTPVVIDEQAYWPVYHVFVDHEYRGQGVAGHLYQALMQLQDLDGLVSDPGYRSCDWIGKWLMARLGGSPRDDGRILIADPLFNS